MQAQRIFTGVAKMESHYCRRHKQRVFRTSLGIKSHIFNEYRRKAAAENKEAVQWSTFQRVFHEMNLSLYAPKKDQCDTCSQYSAGSLPQFDDDAHQERKKLGKK